MDRTALIRKITWVTIFSISMAFIESAVVVYLRVIYYPEGFRFPLKPIVDTMIIIEICREFATIIILLSIAVLAGKRLWERFAYFMFCFGIWDIFYYVWLKVMLDWPSSLLDWDILFLIPLPWIGPVIAPVSIALLMIISGLLIIYSCSRGYNFRPTLLSSLLVSAGTVCIIFSFMRDTGATLHQKLPQPFRYDIFLIGGIFYIIAFMISYYKNIMLRRNSCQK